MDVHSLKSPWNSTGILSRFCFVVVVLLSRARLKSIISLKKLKIVNEFYGQAVIILAFPKTGYIRILI